MDQNPWCPWLIVLVIGFGYAQECGQGNPPTFEGHFVERNEFPWLALLRYHFNDGEDAGFRCMGSLIDSRHVLTSALCATPEGIHVTHARLGDHDLAKNPDCEGCPEVRDIPVQTMFVNVKNFDHENLSHDIALIRLREEVKFSDSIQPICLASKPVSPGDTAIASGWGRTATGRLILTKKKVFSSVIPKEDCQQDYRKYNRTIVDDQLCTRSWQNNTLFTCAGDSGGPLMVFDGKWSQVGVIAFGIGCGSTYADGHTRVKDYLEWIKASLVSE